MRFGSALLDAERIIKDLAVQPGAHLADFGCGKTGHMLFPAAEAVGREGIVYGVDIIKDNLKMFDSLCASRSICNIIPIWGDIEREGGVRIPPHSIDTIFLVNNVALIKSYEGLIHEAVRLLKKDGRIIIIDWHVYTDHPIAPKKELRKEMRDIELIFTKHGMKKIDELPVSKTHWGLVMGKA